MALILSRCRLNTAIKLLPEMNRVRHLFCQLRPNVVENKRVVSCIPSRLFASDSTKDPVKANELKPSVEQIYYGTLTNQVRRLKIFTIMSSFAGLACQPMLFAKIQDYGFSAAVIAMGTFYGFFVMVTPLLIHWVTKRYVTDIEYDANTDKYSIYTYSFFLRRKKIEFTPDDVKVPDIPGIFTSIFVKDKPVFMDPKLFRDVDHYIRIMGYNKPLNLRLEKDATEEAKK